MGANAEGRSVTVYGDAQTLVGQAVSVGDRAPDFVAIASDLSPVPFCSFSGRPCILSSVVSLDTPVCDAQTRRFSEEAARIGPDVRVISLSMDLPFALDRWCGREGLPHVVALSDHRDASFGRAYGVLMRDLRLLARAVFVVDREGVIRHREIVPEVTEAPDYDAALAELRKWA